MKEQTGVDRAERGTMGWGVRVRAEYHQTSPSGTISLQVFSSGSCGFWGGNVKGNETECYILI